MKKYGFTKSELEEFFKNYRIKIVENAKVRSDAREILTKLIDLVYEIIIITARSSENYDNPYEFTKKMVRFKSNSLYKIDC